MIELPLLNAALGDVLEFAAVVAGGHFLRDQVKVGLNDVAHVPQQQGGPLLDIAAGTEVQLPLPPLHHRAGRAGADGGFDFVAPQIGKADGSPDVNAVDLPFEPRVPVYCFHQSPGRRRGHRVVADPLHLHLRPCKQGVIAPDFQTDGHRRSTPSCMVEIAKIKICFTGRTRGHRIHALPSSASSDSPVCPS